MTAPAPPPASPRARRPRDAERRRLGAHYTSEHNILKVLGPLFLDAEQARLAALLADRSPDRRGQLRAFLAALRRLRLFDPACGSGNFLKIAYRELRRLETRALVALADVSPPGARVSLDQCHGIELLPEPAQLAAAALRQVDHACDVELAQALGRESLAPRLTTPNLHVGNALRTDWHQLLPCSDDVLVLGNPPFVGKHYRSPDQRSDMAHVFGPHFHRTGDLDYAACWLVKAAEYCRHSRARCAFVVTSSLCQGEQVPALWSRLFGGSGVKIHFAHRPFRWTGAEREHAHVHVVIIGFGAHDRDDKRIFVSPTGDAGPGSSAVANIGPYLLAGPDRWVSKARAPISPEAPEIRCGNKPSDGGHLVFSADARAEFLRHEPAAGPLFRRFVGSHELLHGVPRWCLWLKDSDPELLRRCPRVLAAVERVRAFRLGSTAAPTRAAAARPAEFFHVSQPTTDYLAIPEVSSERRHYLPIASLPPGTIASNKLYVVPSADLFLFGLLSSTMHMAWMRIVGGRLRGDYQYSGTMIYNPFPWPAHPSESARAAVEAGARAVLAARAEFPERPLAHLYDPHTMPAPLSRAHAALDRAVDRCYADAPFATDEARFQHLFRLYERSTAPARVDATG